MNQRKLQTFKVTEGVYWIEAPTVDLRILCGCPAEIVKHLLRMGYIRSEKSHDITYETGPNAILLSDLLIQNGMLANMAEFPVLQMLYRQGMLLPNHPNNTGTKPLLLGTAEQLEHQLEYIYRGNYGLIDMEEILKSGIDDDLAEQMMAVKLAFAFGKIHPSETFIDTVSIDCEAVTLHGELEIRRLALNCFEFRIGEETAEINLNLPVDTVYTPPYALNHYNVKRAYFSVIHSGEGDGWDINRPCMSSVIMFQGRCYLIDAPPNIDEILKHLGVDLSEVDGIFHTHAHDDHFAGITTLMRAGHRIKYYATALVRNSVRKKLSALTGINNKQFGQFFDVQNLIFDHWNDCDGLEVMPLYSPHPVENNLYMFRTLGPDGYSTYAHWADLTSFKVLDEMPSSATGDFSVSPDFVEQIKTHYLTPANIKKIDIGGGLIHGRAQDFENDTSDSLILAHIDRPLTDAEQEIGSSATFGAENILISTDQDFRRQRSYRYLRSYFPDVPEYRIQTLINVPLINVNAGEIVLGRKQKPDDVHLLVTGSIEYVDASAGIRQDLSTGALIGEKALFQDAATEGTFRTLSHVSLLRIPVSLFRTILEAEGLVHKMRKRIEKIDFLRSSKLLNERISHATLNRVVEHVEITQIHAGSIAPHSQPSSIYIVKEGSLNLITEDGITVESISKRDYFGEESYLPGSGHNLQAHAVDEVVLFHIQDYPLDQIPVVLWKLLETAGRRRSTQAAASDTQK